MTQNRPNLGHFNMISGHFGLKTPKNHEARYFDLTILAATFLIHTKLVTTNNLQN
jgi:hypothetical protein